MITFQQQPDDKTCVSACLAMLLDVPVDQVVREFHDGYMARETAVDTFLGGFGIKAEPCYSAKPAPVENGLYLVAVPSLNIPATTHQVIFDSRDLEDFHFYDPQRGRPDRRFYIWDPEIEPGEFRDDGAVNLKCYAFDWLITGVHV